MQPREGAVRGHVADELELRPMERADVDAVLALAHALGRNVHRAEYERFLGLEGARGLVLLRGGVVRGAVTFLRYFEHGFLGPVLLAPGEDGAGLGLVMAQHAVEQLQRSGVSYVEAEATDAEALVLKGMGFAARRRTLVLERPPRAPQPDLVRATAALEMRHLLDVGPLDAAVAGYGRKGFILSLMEEAPEGARVLETGGEVRGYVLVRRSRRGYHVGPLVTREGDEDAARMLLADALEAAAGWPVVALAPEGDDALRLLKDAGFEPVGALTRMRGGGEGRPDVEGADLAATEWLLGSRITG